MLPAKSHEKFSGRMITRRSTSSFFASTRPHSPLHPSPDHSHPTLSRKRSPFFERKRTRYEFPHQDEKSSYTPLEEQVMALKQAHPGILLTVEHGYRFRFFGDDASIAADLCGISSSINHNFLVASVPAWSILLSLRRPFLHHRTPNFVIEDDGFL